MPQGLARKKKRVSPANHVLIMERDRLLDCDDCKKKDKQGVVTVDLKYICNQCFKTNYEEI